MFDDEFHIGVVLVFALVFVVAMLAVAVSRVPTEHEVRCARATNAAIVTGRPLPPAIVYVCGIPLPEANQ